MDDHTCGGATDIGDLDLPFIGSQRFDNAFIVDLTARLNVETSLGQNDLHLVAKRSRVNRLSIDDNSKHFALAPWAGIGIILHAMIAEFLFLLQVFQYTGEEFRIFTAEFADGFAATRSKAVLFTCGLESFLVHVETVFTRDIA